jgi:hypothetical protein
MFRHFVGNVFVFNYDMQAELPFVDVPVLTQPLDAPESLLIHIDDRELSEHSLDKLRYLHSQQFIPMDLIRENSGVSPEGQVHAAEKIASNLNHYKPLLSWQNYPTKIQRYAACELIFNYLMDGKGINGIFSAKQMSFKLGSLTRIQKVSQLIINELANNKNVHTATQAVEGTLGFLRQWAEFHFPRYITALDRIQRHVLSTHGAPTGNYEKYSAEIKKLFMPLSATVLEEYGIPWQVSEKIEEVFPLGDNVDEILISLAKLDLTTINLNPFEQEMVSETIQNL